MPDPREARVRVRFAPSPTGFLHIGGLRTALYNYLVARRDGGDFILRIEDTDRTRYVEEAEPDILESLHWAGLDYDEGPEAGGDHVPYYQSERTDLYRRNAEQLVEEGHAYYAFDTPEELDAMRQRLEEEGASQQKYDAASRQQMRNSLTLPEDEVRRLIDDGVDHVVRLKMPAGETIRFDDVIRGSVSIDTSELDDQVLLKSDGLPTYHLANVVDDHHMEVTHVIRGEEWLPSTPKHVLLYEYLGWEPPQFAHLPLILSPNGGKLSKRNAGEMGIPVSVREYREAGFEPEAVVNFLAFLGWNPGDERELFSLDELVETFSLDRVSKSGVQFSMDKLQWFNQQHIRRLAPAELARRVRRYLSESGVEADNDYLERVTELVQDRISTVKEIATVNRFFFEDPAEYEAKGVKKRWKDDSADLMRVYADRLEAADRFDEESTEAILRDLADERDHGAGRIIHPTRLSISGMSYGPSLFAMMDVLGRDRCVRRMRRAAETLG